MGQVEVCCQPKSSTKPLSNSAKQIESGSFCKQDKACFPNKYGAEVRRKSSNQEVGTKANLFYHIVVCG